MFRKSNPVKEEQDTLLNNLKNAKATINQPISIMDIYVYPEKDHYAYGESKTHTNVNKQNVVERLTDLIELYAKIANTYHQKNYCVQEEDGNFTTKEDCLNKITRLLSIEFSFYARQPLTISEFTDLIKKIEAIGKQQHENVHLLLSSFSVVNANSEILNLSLYVECGQNTKINSFAKVTEANYDVGYPGHKIFRQSNLDLNELIKSPIKGFAASGNFSHVVSSQNVFIIQLMTTGAQLLMGIDICLDNQTFRAQRLAEEFIKQNESQLLSEQANYVLSSNSELKDFSKVVMATVFTQVDPKSGRFSYERIETNMVTTEEFENLVKKMKETRYPNMEIFFQNDGCFVKNPPFGSNIDVIVSKEVKCGKLHSELQPLAEENNRKISENYIKARLHYKEPYENTCKCKNELNDFFTKLLLKCRIGFAEKSNKPPSYHAKTQAQKAIQITYQTILEIFDNHPYDLIPNSKSLLIKLNSELVKVQEQHACPIINELVFALESKINQPAAEKQLQMINVKK